MKINLSDKMCLLLLVAGTLIMMIVMAKTGATLKTPATPKGILDLEFAYSQTKVATVMTAWADNGSINNVRVAKENTWFDFIFIFFYSLLLSRVCNMIAISSQGLWSGTGRLLAKAALIAGLLDVLENIGMLITLGGHRSGIYAAFTAFSSILKWGIVIITLLYILIAGLVISYTKLTRSL